jgi:hypothetical protein
MESFEALSTAINRNTVKHAKALGLATSTVNKWQEPSTDFNDSGSYNPLDRIETIIKTALEMGNPADAATMPVQYLAQRFNLFVTPLPPTNPGLSDIIQQIHKTTREFADLIKVSSDAIEDGRFTPDRRRRIEKEGLHLLTAVSTLIKMIQEKSR